MMTMRDRGFGRGASPDNVFVTAPSDSTVRDADLAGCTLEAEDLPTLGEVLQDIAVAVGAFAALAVAANVFVLVTQGG